jgi:hypothetical protein
MRDLDDPKNMLAILIFKREYMQWERVFALEMSNSK